MDMGHDFLIFALQLAFPLAGSLLVTRSLLPPLQPLLEELCGGAARARFWVIYSGLVFFLFPLLVVIAAMPPPGDFGGLLRTVLARTLGGALLALLATGFVILRTIRAFEERVS